MATLLLRRQQNRALLHPFREVRLLENRAAGQLLKETLPRHRPYLRQQSLQISADLQERCATAAHLFVNLFTSHVESTDT